MAFAEQDKVFVNFTGGLNTEATPLNFPENSAQALDNFDLFVTGEVKRRLGVDFEAAHLIRPETTSSTNISSYAVATHEWKSANGSSDLNFLVVQIGLKLFFHNLGDEPLSGTLRGTLNLEPFKTTGSAETRVLSVAFGEGVMVAGHSDIEPVLVEYDEDDDSFSVRAINIKIRDFDGIEEDLDTDERPSSLTSEHRYNLRNQGWPTTATVNRVPRGSRGVLRNVDPITYTRSNIGVYPSNADIFYAAKAEAAQDAEVLGTFSPWALEHDYFGNTPAPKGHFILDAFNQFRVFPKYTKSTNRRPNTLGFYAGRAWYAGVPDPKYTGEIYFSQSLTSSDNVGLCYQEYDPTSEDLNALLATDGGTIRIAGIGEVLAMEEVGSDLIIISNNGVWAISGGEASGNFQADSFSVRKVSDQGAIGRRTIIVAESVLIWWGEGGIWAMSRSEIDGSPQVDRITRNSIQTFYDSLSVSSKKLARGLYDNFSKKIYWLFNDTEDYDGSTDRFQYNRALILDTTLGSFYTYTFADLDNNSPWIADILSKAPGSRSTIGFNIFQGEDNIVEDSDNIIQDLVFETFSEVKLKFLTFVENENGTFSYTFSDFKDNTFHDWKTWDQEKNDINGLGASYDSFIQTGWNTFDDLLRDKTITHLTSFFNRTEQGYKDTSTNNIVEFDFPSSAFMQLRWEFTEQDIGRWSNPIQAYRLRQSYIPQDSVDPFDYGYTVVSSKLRTRGKGTAFSVRYSSEEGKDLQLLGFAVNVRAGAKP